VVEKVYKAAPVVPLDALTREGVPAALRGHVSAPVVQVIIERSVEALREGTLDARAETQLNCVTAVVDQKGWEECAEIVEQASKDVAAAQARSAKRLPRGSKSEIPATIVLASFESPKPGRS
jgi:hypothetical protein